MNYMNPKQMVMNMIQNNTNPMVRKLMNMNYEQLEQFAVNYCNERGVDFHKEFDEFKRKNGLVSRADYYIN